MSGGKKSLLWSLTCTAWLLMLPGQEAAQPEVMTQLGLVRGKHVAVRELTVLWMFSWESHLPSLLWELGDSLLHSLRSLGRVCLQELERTDLMKNTLDGKQQLFPISEDCLYLNIYTPTSRQKKDKLPVMFWIHGGSLAIGSASSQDGSPLSAYEDIVVVLVQYRLGIQGFLSTGDELAPGNWGFLDLVAALQWVQGNIAHFGGDPGSVTISGQSAGGAAVSLLVLSPLTKGLFHRAISQSGVSILPGMLTNNPFPVFQTIAQVFGCEGSSSAILIQCLRNKDNMIFTRNLSSLPLIPMTVDGVFLLKLPEKMFSENEFPRVPYLLGVNNHEFGWSIPLAWFSKDLENGMKKEIALNMLKNRSLIMGIPPELIHLAADVYIGNQTDPLAIQNAALDIFGDMFILQSLKFSEDLRDSGVPVYFYEFQHRPSAFDKIKPAYVRADHSAELPFIWGGPFMTDEGSMLAFPDSTEEEKQLSRAMMRYWANFIRTGDPNGEGLPNWPLFDQSESYLEFNLTLKIRRKLKEDKMGFWRKFIHEKVKPYVEGKKAHVEL